MSCNLVLQKDSLQKTSNGCWLTSKKVSHHYMSYNTGYTINYIYMQWLDYHTHGKKIQYFMYIFKDLHFHIQFIKFKKVLCTKSHVYRVYKSLFLWLYHHTNMLKTIILQTLRFLFYSSYSWHPYTIPLFLKCELQRK